MTKKFLIVEDNDSDQKIVKRVIQKSGLDCEITFLNDGEDVVKKARDIKPDLILMDIMLPGKLGGDSVLELRKDLQTAHIPIVFLSNMLEKSAEKEGGKKIKIGEEWFDAVAKPVDQDHFIKVVVRYLGEIDNSSKSDF